MILDDVGVTKKIWSDYILVTFWLHIMVYGYTESDVIAESRGWNAMSGDNDVVCVLWICVVVGTESYVCDQLPKLPEEPPPIGDCANLALVSVHEFGFGGQYLWYFRCETHNKFRDLLLKDVHQGLSHFHAIHIGGDSGMANSVHGFGKDRSFGK